MVCSCCFFFAFILAACGGGGNGSVETRSDTCQLAFKVSWGAQDRAAGDDQGVPRAIVCADIASVSAYVYDDDSGVLSSGGPWDCAAGSATMENVPAGGSARVVVLGSVGSGRVLYWGRSEQIYLEANTVVDAGTIVADSFVPVIVAPADQASVNPDAFALVWQVVTGADGYRVVIARDEGFSDVVIDETVSGETTSTYSPLGLESGYTYFWRINAVDMAGNQGGGSIVRQFSVTEADNSPPVVVILSPTDEARFEYGTNVVFSGSASDAEDVVVPASALQWSSDVDGLIGNGATVQTAGLSEGTHQITLTATDSQGLSQSTGVSIIIYQPSDYDLSGLWSFTLSTPSVTGPCPAGSASSGTCRIIQTGNLFSLEFISGVTCDPEFSCYYEGNVSGNRYTGANEGEDGSGGLISNTITFTAASADLGSGEGESVYSGGAVQCIWTQGIGLTRLTSGANQPPVATIINPGNGLIYNAGERISFTGSGSDEEDGSIPDAGLTWTSSIDGLIGIGDVVAYQDFSMGTHEITLTATDGEGATGTDAITLTINAPPVVVINSPPNGFRYDTGTEVIFTGSAVDAEDGTLGGSSLEWTSSIAGTMGSGSPLSMSDLSYGSHTITLTATDSRGLTASSAINLLLNNLPYLELYQPTNGANIDPDMEFGLEVGTGTYDPDEVLPNSAFVWTSSRDGELGVGNYLLVNASDMSYGVHTITCTATDSLGGTTSASRTDHHQFISGGRHCHSTGDQP